MTEPLYRNKEWLEQKYWVECLHFNEIAELVDVTPSCISTWFAKLGIERKQDQTIPLLMTREEVLTHKADNQQIISTVDDYPSLHILFDNEDTMSAFVKDYVSRKSVVFRNSVVLIDQVGDKIHVTYHHKKISRMGPETEHGPTIHTFNVSKIDYREYINSPEWYKKSSEIKKRVGKCQVCGSQYNLRTHHNTYENLGDEKPEDLIVLCDTCHGIFHRRGRIKPNNHFSFTEK